MRGQCQEMQLVAHKGRAWCPAEHLSFLSLKEEPSLAQMWLNTKVR